MEPAPARSSAIVFGASGAIGRALTERLAMQGEHTVYGAVRDPGVALPTGVRRIGFDLADEASIAAAVALIEEPPTLVIVATGLLHDAAGGIEAYRPVTVREGEQIIELPAIQAVFRAMGVAAMKGNRFVQKTLTDMVAKMEAEHHATKLELFGTMVEYKHQWDQEIERCRNAGLPEPKMIPHPDDIILDPNTGDAKILGPQTKEQKQRYDHALERRLQAQHDVSYFADRYRRARDPKLKARYLEEWHFEQRMFDIINDVVGPRYKAKLENRSYADGASREGKALDDMRRSRLLREEMVG